MTLFEGPTVHTSPDRLSLGLSLRRVPRPEHVDERRRFPRRCQTYPFEERNQRNSIRRVPPFPVGSGRNPLSRGVTVSVGEGRETVYH